MTVDLVTRNEMMEWKRELLEKVEKIEQLLSPVQKSKPLLKPKQVREELNCSTNTLNKLIIEGMLTPVRYLGQNLFKAEEVERIKNGYE